MLSSAKDGIKEKLDQILKKLEKMEGHCVFCIEAEAQMEVVEEENKKLKRFCQIYKKKIKELESN